MGERLSVVLLTCDGERWIADQVRSVLEQSRTPDEIVVCDDASTDATVAVVEELLTGFAGTATVLTTPTRLGVRANLERGLWATTGDLVAPCDQDDVWAPCRLELSVAAIAEPGTWVTFGNGTLLGSPGTLWERAGFAGAVRQRWAEDPLGVLLHRTVATGTAMLLRRELVDLALPLDEEWWHDAWWCELAVLAGHPPRPVDAPLLAYRLHDDQQAGLRPAGVAARRAARDRRRQDSAAATRQWTAALQRLAQRQVEVPDDLRDRVSAARAFATWRTQLSGRTSGRVLPVGRRLVDGSYRRHADGLRSAAGDLLTG